MEKKFSETIVIYNNKTYRLICEKVKNILIYKAVLYDGA